MRLSQHSKRRIKERTDIKKRGQSKFFRLALNRGLCYQQAVYQKYDKLVIDYLKRKQGNGKAKIYNGYIFFYSKHNKTLYTMYKIPEDIEELIKKKKKEIDSCKRK